MLCPLFISEGLHPHLLLSVLRLTDKTPKEYAVYRSPLLFWGLVDLVYDMFRVKYFACRYCKTMVLCSFWGYFVKIGIITCKNRIQNVVCLGGGCLGTFSI